MNRYLRNARLLTSSLSSNSSSKSLYTASVLVQSASPISCRSFMTSSLYREGSAAVDPKIEAIVNDIAKLNLLEAAELVKELKSKLNIQEVAMPVMAAAPAASAAPAEAAQQEEKPVEKTTFTIKLEKVDASAKAKLIREIKTLIPGSNLVEAKKFVESVPKVIKESVPKEEAEKIKKHLESLGSVVVLE